MANRVTVIKTRGKPKVPLKYFPIFLVTVIFIAFSFSGYTGVTTNYIAFALFGLWIIVAALTDIRSFMRIFRKKSVIAFCFYIIFFAITALFSPSFYQTVKLMGAKFVLFSPVFIFTYFSYLRQERLFKRLLIASLIVLSYFCVVALNFYSNNENAARILASNTRAFDNLAIGGGYGLAYGAAIFAVYLFDLWLNRAIKIKKLRVFTLFAVIILIFVVMETQSTITLLVLFVGLVLSYALKKDHVQIGKIPITQTIRRKTNFKINLKKIFILAIAILLLIMFAFFYQDIGFWIIDKTYQSSDIVFSRIGEIGAKMAYGEASLGDSEDLDARTNILKTALGSFVNSPIIGHGYKYGYVFDYGYLYGIGNHCEWLDAFATMGLLGGIPFLLIYVFTVSEERKYNKKRVSYAYIIVLFLLGLLNPFQTFQSHFMLFYLIPSICYLMADHFNRKEIINVQSENN